VITSGVDGVLVPVNQPERVSQCLLALLANGPMREQLGAAARRRALSWDQAVVLPRLAGLIEFKAEMTNVS
jgi:hypothetical protein